MSPKPLFAPGTVTTCDGLPVCCSCGLDPHRHCAVQDCHTEADPWAYHPWAPLPVLVGLCRDHARELNWPIEHNDALACIDWSLMREKETPPPVMHGELHGLDGAAIRKAVLRHERRTGTTSRGLTFDPTTLPKTAAEPPSPSGGPHGVASEGRTS